MARRTSLTPDGSFEESTRVRAVPGNLSSDLGREAVILEPGQGIYYGLNEVGARIWQLVQEPRSIGAIVDAIGAEYDVDRDTCLQDVRRLVGEMRERGLVTIIDGSDP